MFNFNIDANALEVTAASCSRDHVAAAITTVMAAPEGGTVHIPAGTCEWTTGINLSSAKPLSIIGAGMTQTIIKSGPAWPSSRFFFTGNTMGYRRVSGIKFDTSGRPYANAGGIQWYRLTSAGFRIDHCHFYGAWYPAIEIRYANDGLIDSNIIEDDTGDTAHMAYGIDISSYVTGMPGVPPCNHTYNNLDQTDYDLPACYNAWDAWWDDLTYHNFAFDENVTLGGPNAIFIEGNQFLKTRSAVVGNWGSGQHIVIRHNTFTLNNNYHLTGGFKPGTISAEVYNNTFSYTGASAEQPESLGIISLRGGVVYNNTWNRMSPAGILYLYKYGYGYLYTKQTQMKELYIYNNTYNDCTRSGDDDYPTGAWKRETVNGVTPVKNVNYFYRAPQAGDRIYPYTPYTYPHPLVSGGSNPVSNPLPPPNPPPNPPKNLHIINP